MKTRLLFVALLASSCAGAYAQTWTNPLPLDNATGFITYRGRVEAPGQSQEQLGARATRFATTGLANPTATAEVDSQKQQQLTVKGNGQRMFTWRGGAPGSAGRVLHYVLEIHPHAGYYDYQLSELVNETPAVQARIAPGMATTIAPQIGAVEAVLRNPSSFDKKHNPTPAFRAYCEAVNAAAQTSLADVRAALVR